MNQQTSLIPCEYVSAAQVHRYAEERRTVLLDAIPAIQVPRKRHDPPTQDIGHLLHIILDASSITAFVIGRGNWLYPSVDNDKGA